MGNSFVTGLVARGSSFLSGLMPKPEGLGSGAGVQDEPKADRGVWGRVKDNPSPQRAANASQSLATQPIDHDLLGAKHGKSFGDYWKGFTDVVQKLRPPPPEDVAAKAWNKAGEKTDEFIKWGGEKIGTAADFYADKAAKVRDASAPLVDTLTGGDKPMSEEGAASEAALKQVAKGEPVTEPLVPRGAAMTHLQEKVLDPVEKGVLQPFVRGKERMVEDLDAYASRHNTSDPKAAGIVYGISRALDWVPVGESVLGTVAMNAPIHYAGKLVRPLEETAAGKFFKGAEKLAPAYAEESGSVGKIVGKAAPLADDLATPMLRKVKKEDEELTKTEAHAEDIRLAAQKTRDNLNPQTILDHHNKNGGGTHHPLEGNLEGRDLWAHSIKDHEVRHDGELTLDNIRDYLSRDDVKARLSSGEYSLGTWKTTNAAGQDQHVLDMSRTSSSLRDAVTSAIAHDQEGIFHLQKGNKGGGTEGWLPRGLFPDFDAAETKIAKMPAASPGDNHIYITPDGKPIASPGGDHQHVGRLWGDHNAASEGRGQQNVNVAHQDLGLLRVSRRTGREGVTLQVSYTPGEPITEEQIDTIRQAVGEAKRTKQPVTLDIASHDGAGAGRNTIVRDPSISGVEDALHAVEEQIGEDGKITKPGLRFETPFEQGARAVEGGEDKGTTGLIPSTKDPVFSGEPIPIEGTGKVRKSGPEKGQRIHTLGDVQDALGNLAREGGASTSEKDIAEQAIPEVMAHRASESSGIGWYEHMVDRAMEIMTNFFPSLKDNPARGTIFKAFWATLSYGKHPNDNMKAAKKAFEIFEKTGKFSIYNFDLAERQKLIDAGFQSTGQTMHPKTFRIEGSKQTRSVPGWELYKNSATGETAKLQMDNWGHRQQGHQGGFKSLQKLYDHFDGDENKVAQWLVEEHTPQEIHDMHFSGHASGMTLGGGNKIGGMMLGPKGGAFFGNLNGIHSGFTMDVWATRTWRRWTGMLQRTGKGFGAEAAPSPAERKAASEFFSKLGKHLNMKVDDLQATMWYYEQKLYAAHGVKSRGAGDYASAAEKLLGEERAVKPAAAEQGKLFEGVGGNEESKGAEGLVQPAANAEKGAGVAGGGEAGSAGSIAGGGKGSPSGTTPRAAGGAGVAHTIEPSGWKAGASKEVRSMADSYIKENKIPSKPRSEIVGTDPRAPQIADAYDAMKHDPKNPKVRASYDALIKETDAQFDYAQKHGMKFEPWGKEGQPYANSAEMMKDVRENNHLYFFKGGDLPKDHPLAGVDPKTGLTHNDKFRAIHDLFGHAQEGNEFGPKGEENAWMHHSRMFSDKALPAMTTETKGQNSWLNAGPHMRGENVPALKDRPFPEQKAGLLPAEFYSREGAKSPIEKAGLKFSYEATPTHVESGLEQQRESAHIWRLRDAKGNKVGHIMAVENPAKPGTLDMHLTNLNKEFRGKGIGMQMYEQFIEEARQKGFKSIRSDVRSEDAQRLWTKLRKKYNIVEEKMGHPPTTERFQDLRLKLREDGKVQIGATVLAGTTAAGLLAELAGAEPASPTAELPKPSALQAPKPPEAKPKDEPTPENIKKWVGKHARAHSIDPKLLHEVVRAESTHNPNAQSKKGATGLTQLMPTTAKAMGVDPRDPEQNVLGGAKYLAQMRKEFRGDMKKALAAYNAGPTKVRSLIDQHGEQWLDHAPKETRKYVDKILRRYNAGKTSSKGELISGLTSKAPLERAPESKKIPTVKTGAFDRGETEKKAEKPAKSPEGEWRYSV